jgi:predicted DNA-binding transcriptional regulator YafY
MLKSKAFVTTDDIVERLEISKRTVYRVIATMRDDHGFPLEFVWRQGWRYSRDYREWCFEEVRRWRETANSASRS